MNAKDRAARNRQALELHLAGATYQKIADALGFASKASAHAAVRSALTDAAAVFEGDDPVQTELARIDGMLIGLWPKARKGDVASVREAVRLGQRRLELLALGRTASADVELDPLDELRARRDSKRAG